MNPDDLPPVPDPPAPDALTGARVLTMHVNEDGHCRACITERARLVSFPCPETLLARLVPGRHDVETREPGEER
jgi:hypothetical protein